ncbi:acetyl/propionyl/methylcrotonyl-CoA carboxylase subunit alpha [Amylibacter marinus]|nr:acetyl/propionyl/methylcrotonyl-CoA carboxylase subunit alpha [Amylibacter marinus]
MFTKILVANRGEIACRIFETAQKMRINTVAVYSDADAQSRHVRMADQAVHIGGSAASDSYLLGARIIQAALDTGAQAIHPGYGFLSENPDFAQAVADAGLVFVGPSPESIRKMGLKDEAKRLMEQAGVPVVPGYHGAEQEASFLAQEAEKIGYPVMIKARAGGGGKGMRLVEKPADFAAALASAASEGQASFGDSHVLIEKFITAPRHIEVQVFGDTHGNVVHLFERDCSLQRRHQKVIEEAPAPDMPLDVRDAMTTAAINAARQIDYVGAGTIEFIVDGSGPLRKDGFWFMEMNTRLQVEHPVTEEITGQDLVEWQLMVASGAPMPKAQDQLEISGHALEARIYAEDPRDQFKPTPGPLNVLQFGTGCRVETGVEAGDLVSPYYDPMIAKLVTHAPTRAQAIAQLDAGLKGTLCLGPKTNVDFLTALNGSEKFGAAQLDTGLIDRDLAQLVSYRPPSALALLTACVHLSGIDLTSPTLGWRQWGQGVQTFQLMHEDEIIALKLQFEENGQITVLTSDETIILDQIQSVDNQMTANEDGQKHQTLWARHGSSITVKTAGCQYDFTAFDALMQAGDDGQGSGQIRAPMTGTITSVLVKAGQEVTQDTPLVVVEAMKMEHVIKAPFDGVINEVFCTAGSAVDDGADLLVLSEAEE